MEILIKKCKEMKSAPCNQGTKIRVPKVFRRIPKNSSTNICGVPRNSDSYPPNTLAIRALLKFITVKVKSWKSTQIDFYAIFKIDHVSSSENLCFLSTTSPQLFRKFHFFKSLLIFFLILPCMFYFKAVSLEWYCYFLIRESNNQYFYFYKNFQSYKILWNFHGKTAKGGIKCVTV